MESPLPTDDESTRGTRNWPHAPPHRLAEAGVYFVTARAAEQRHLLGTPERRDWFQVTLFALAGEKGWTLEAWAVLSNHYHFVALSPKADAISLSPMLQKLHSLTTKECNRLDCAPGRTRLWHNFRETHLTFQRSYLARLHYVHSNAVHHGLAPVASQWKWCSAAAFEREATAAWVKTIGSFKYDQIAHEDGE